MAVFGAEILSAVGCFYNQLEFKNPFTARPYAYSLTHTLRGNSTLPRLKTHTHKSLCRESLFSFSAPESGIKITGEDYDGFFLGLETSGQRIRKDSC